MDTVDTAINFQRSRNLRNHLELSRLLLKLGKEFIINKQKPREALY